MNRKKDPVTLNPYIFPGLKLNQEDKMKLVSDKLHERFRISKQELLQIVSEECGVTIPQLTQRIRKKEIVNARFILCGILKDKFGYTLKRIGQEIDGRDHTTVMNAIKEYRNRIHFEENFKNMVSNIYNRIGQKTF